MAVGPLEIDGARSSSSEKAKGPARPCWEALMGASTVALGGVGWLHDAVFDFSSPVNFEAEWGGWGCGWLWKH